LGIILPLVIIIWPSLIKNAITDGMVTLVDDLALLHCALHHLGLGFRQDRRLDREQA
jgi:hypothetical protein